MSVRAPSIMRPSDHPQPTSEHVGDERVASLGQDAAQLRGDGENCSVRAVGGDPNDLVQQRLHTERAMTVA